MRYGNDDSWNVLMTPVYETDNVIPTEHILEEVNCECAYPVTVESDPSVGISRGYWYCEECGYFGYLQ